MIKVNGVRQYNLSDLQRALWKSSKKKAVYSYGSLWKHLTTEPLAANATKVPHGLVLFEGEALEALKIVRAELAKGEGRGGAFCASCTAVVLPDGQVLRTPDWLAEQAACSLSAVRRLIYLGALKGLYWCHPGGLWMTKEGLEKSATYILASGYGARRTQFEFTAPHVLVFETKFKEDPNGSK